MIRSNFTSLVCCIKCCGFEIRFMQANNDGKGRRSLRTCDTVIKIVVLGRFEGNIVVVARSEVPSITNNNRSRYLFDCTERGDFISKFFT